jgi:tetratricopeptide (TPR) repeat protein
MSNRPGIDNRPGIGNRPGIDNRPGIGNRPGIDNRPGIGNRPGIDNRPGIGNRPGIDNRPGIGNRPIVGNRVNINRPVNINGGYNYYRNYHSGWHNGYWNNWYRSPLVWAGAGAAAGWLAAPGPTYEYSNPYYEEAWAPSIPALDYSQPISVPTVTAAPVVEASEDTSPAPLPAESQEPAVPNEALERFDAARAAFNQGDYAKAQKLVEQAIELLPQDAALHEFRALTLFAQKDYQQAAAALYAVLAAGPGWTWETLAPMYANPETYTQQLRALEAYARAHPKSSAAHFLLAYHYLVLDHPPEAVKQLQEVVKLSPHDQLAKQLLQAFTKPETPEPASPG